MDDTTRLYILRKALEEAVQALELLAQDPKNHSEFSPDIHRWKSDLEYTK